MSRTFLNEEESNHFLKSFNLTSSRVNSEFLERILIEKLKTLGTFEKLSPILLGSWARHELCPGSDLDIIFLGNEAEVYKYITTVQESGLKLRYRVPKNLQAWGDGVEDFDVLALLGARALYKKDEAVLNEQKQRLLSRGKTLRARFLKAVLAERERRQKRLDSITNFLEPNLKFSPGGLRDIEQALQLYNLFVEKIENPQHALETLEIVKGFLIVLRQRLHMEGGHDILTGPDQNEMAKYFKFPDLGSLMKEVQKSLSRTFFYSEWILESARSSRKKTKAINQKKFNKPEQLSQFLKQDSGILMQKRVRESMDKLFPNKETKVLSPVQANGIKALLDKNSKDELIVAIFSSRLMDKLLPPVRKLVGHVQHDQYHRFTADIHLQQACRQFLRVRKSAKVVGSLAFVHRQMREKDWQIIGWACLFHDLEKGQGGDHSQKGAASVLKMIPSSAFSLKDKTELAWLVENHLLLSTLAFKRSSFSWRTLHDLQNHGITRERLRRLAIFTVIDIKATNPEAWTIWKAQLLADFMKNWESPEGQKRQDFVKQTEKLIPQFPGEILSGLDSFLIQQLNAKTLALDLQGVLNSKEKKSVRTIKVSGRTWVRFYDSVDRPGLLVTYLERLHGVGASVQHASIQTLGDLGVYDWFQVHLPKGKEKLLQQNFSERLSVVKPVKFDPIEVAALDQNEWLVTLKAKDQKGLLKSACHSLSAIGANIKSAQVHTWGLNVEDVFVISYQGTQESLVERLTFALQGNH